MASTNRASDGSSRSKVSAFLNMGPAGSRPVQQRWHQNHSNVIIPQENECVRYMYNAIHNLQKNGRTLNLNVQNLVFLQFFSS